MSDFGVTYTPIARKQHRCEWCFGPIPKDELHKRYRGVYDGGWQGWRMHTECYDDSQNEFLASGESEFTAGCAEWPQRIKDYWNALKERNEPVISS